MSLPYVGENSASITAVQEKEVSMNPKKDIQRELESAATASKTTESFSAAEKAAMKERAKELKAEARAEKNRAEGEKNVLDKIAEMPEPDRTLGMRIHEIIKASAPDLIPRTWYGMPAYARDGKIVCFFQAAVKFDTRYSTLGFNDSANLDEGAMWPVAYALKELGADEAAKISALVKKAVS